MGIQKITATIEYKGKIIQLETTKGKLLGGVLSDAGISISQPCGGTGRCGKCKVRFISGAPKCNSYDMRFLSQKEMNDGYRLLCRCILVQDCQIQALLASVDESSIAVESIRTDNIVKNKYDRYAIALDIGTTTIAAALVGYDKKGTGGIVKTASGINHQREYGGDVINRISAAEDISIRDKLRSIVLKDIADIVGELTYEMGVSAEYMCIAGNTTMLYLLQGYDPGELGKYPYIATKIATERTMICGIDTLIFPGISAFVGADIVAGLYSLDFIDHSPNIKVLLDLGTNGEMAFYNEGMIKVASTAAGPVFEGGGISCGVPSVNGAIDHIKIKKHSDGTYNNEVTVYGDSKPIGLCGTGVIEIVAELLKNKIIDGTGLLIDDFFELGYPIFDELNIYFTQQDIRNVQLAKAAIYTGLKTLVGKNNPDKIYVSGGFGSHMNMDKIIEIGMIPREYSGKIVAVGNSSLQGCIKYIMARFEGYEDDALAYINKITEISETIVLASEEQFSTDYIEAMSLKKENDYA